MSKIPKWPKRLADIILETPDHEFLSSPIELNELRTTISKATHIDGTRVQEWIDLNGMTLQDSMDMDVPNASPPFERFMVELKTPSNRRGAVLIHAQEMQEDESAEHNGARWLLVAIGLARLDTGSIIVMNEILSIYVSGSGKVLNHDIYFAKPQAGLLVSKAGHALQKPQEATAAMLTCMTHVALLNVSFFHCRNLVSVTHTAPRENQKARQKSNKEPFVAYRTIFIDSVAREVESHSDGTGSGLKKALHICRGHFRTYTPEAPLFGHVTGTVWCPQHTRGRLKEGCSIKQYKVRP